MTSRFIASPTTRRTSKADRDLKPVVSRSSSVSAQTDSRRRGSRGESLCTSEKGAFRAAWWPWYILCDCLPFNHRNQLENMLVPGVVASRATVDDLHIRLLLDRLRASIEAFNVEDFVLHDESGRNWKVTVRIWSGILDLDVSPLALLELFRALGRSSASLAGVLSGDVIFVTRRARGRRGQDIGQCLLLRRDFG